MGPVWINMGRVLPHITAHMDRMANSNSYIQMPSDLLASPAVTNKSRKITMSKTATASPEPPDENPDSANEFAGLFYFAERFPHRQFTSAELSIISGFGHTAISTIRNAADTPFSLGKCSLRRLDAWLEKHPGFKSSRESRCEAAV
jgi:hypothetical protein